MRCTLILLVLLVGSASADRRGGANHHLGDDSFVAAYGRDPLPVDGEHKRMRVHLRYVHDLLAARAATAPELEGRRAELLGYLDDYIAKGITPRNTYVPWRNPVFIDRDDNICAVGYLIERSAGRALPEAIAASHRLDYLEDIAAAMPEVAAWVASSGFTLDELASIQPGYEGPEVMHVAGWVPEAIKDGPYAKDGMTGAFAKQQMVGPWKHVVAGKTLGYGEFKAGTGTWKSYRADGSLMATGAFARSHADGDWKFFFPSGRLAATGAMRKGQRDGAWTFFHDTKASIPLARGRFAKGEVIGDWKHFDDAGKLVATASGRAWAGLALAVEPGKDGIRHELHQGIPAESYRLDGFYLGSERLYVQDGDTMFDADGNQLERAGDAWTARACKWGSKRKQAAKAGDVTKLHQLLRQSRFTDSPTRNEDECSSAVTAVATKRVKRFEAMLASRSQIHAPIPAFAFDPQPATTAEPVDDTQTTSEADAPPVFGRDNPADLATYLADHMTWYMEWPYIDDTFSSVYQSLPGYARSSDE